MTGRTPAHLGRIPPGPCCRTASSWGECSTGENGSLAAIRRSFRKRCSRSASSSAPAGGDDHWDVQRFHEIRLCRPQSMIQYFHQTRVRGKRWWARGRSPVAPARACHRHYLSEETVGLTGSAVCVVGWRWQPTGSLQVASHTVQVVKTQLVGYR
jgi:hypothetical protein